MEFAIIGIGIFVLLAYALCYVAGNADERMAEGFYEAFVEGDDE